jgi:large subunit ribosomal protein L10
MEEAGKIIDGPTALIYSEPKGKSDDPITLSKALFTWRDKNPDSAKILEIKGGFAEGRFVTGEQVTQFSKMPSREMLLSMMAYAFSAPMSRLAFVLNNLPQKTAYALKALLDKKPAEAPPAAQAPANDAPAPSQN